MLRSVVYDTYCPYAHGGDGLEYQLDLSEEDVIDYNDYYHSSFDTFWAGMVERFNAYRTTFPSKVSGELTNYITKEGFQAILLNIFNKQKEDRAKDPYFCYVQMDNEAFYEKVNKSTIELIQFLINQNQYTIYNNDEKRFEIESFESGDTSYKDVKFYMGVDSFIDLNGNTVNKFHYYEFKFNKKKIQHKIIRLVINAPIGTTFYLNRQLHPITVHNYQSTNIINGLKGEYVLEPENYVTLQYVTFPKDAIPKYKTCYNEKWKYGDPEDEIFRNINEEKDLNWTVSYIYDDEYDVEYVEE